MRHLPTHMSIKMWSISEYRNQLDKCWTVDDASGCVFGRRNDSSFLGSGVTAGAWCLRIKCFAASPEVTFFLRFSLLAFVAHTLKIFVSFFDQSLAHFLFLLEIISSSWQLPSSTSEVADKQSSKIPLVRRLGSSFARLRLVGETSSSTLCLDYPLWKRSYFSAAQKMYSAITMIFLHLYLCIFLMVLLGWSVDSATYVSTSACS